MADIYNRYGMDYVTWRQSRADCRPKQTAQDVIDSIALSSYALNLKPPATPAVTTVETPKETPEKKTLSGRSIVL